MKKKLISFLLVFILTLTGVTACGSSDGDANAENSAQEEQTEASDEEEPVEEETTATENPEVNEYGLKEEEWNLLMEKYRANMAEWIQEILAWEETEEFQEMDHSSIPSIHDDASRLVDMEGYRLLAMPVAAGDDVSEGIDQMITFAEEHGWGGEFTQADEMFLPALAEWKDEVEIDDERLAEFVLALTEDMDSFKENYAKPMVEELIQSAQ